MNRPPPVIFPVGIRTASRSVTPARRLRLGGVNLGGAIAGLWLLATMPVLAALVLHPPARAHVAAWALALAASIPGTFLAWRFWRGQIPGAISDGTSVTLIWNGAEWLLEKGTGGGAVTAIAPPAIHFDGQCWLLLRARMGRRRRTAWLWVARAADPARWHALRCALYSPAALMPPAQA